ncbi:MAG: response regulator transcription factor [Bacteroidetes bacterium]|nr:MAG: response regulator transcription factor [Bacteroidota bacterium]
MTILIIEDEKPAAEKLIQSVKRFNPEYRIEGPLASVRESIRWLKAHEPPDLILLDIQLSDGLSLDIFKSVNVESPLIFTTAFDEYLLEAFEFNSIDYLLKPIKEEKLENALSKYLKLKKHFTSNITSLAQYLNEPKKQYKSRIVVRKGIDYLSVGIDSIAYFYTEHKITFLIDKEGKRYIVDKPLSELEADLDPAQFYRLNRKFLASISSVQKFSSKEKGKLKVELSPLPNDEVIVSQENAGEFKQWVGK